MESILKKFTNEPLFDACATMLGHLHIKFNEVTREPIPFESLYPTQLPVALKAVLDKVNNTYFVGTIDEESLAGNSSTKSADEVTDIAEKGKYIGMMIFAVDIKKGQLLTRTESATLTRGFNRIAAAQPVVLFIKQENTLALSTCERSNYSQAWRDGEKLGKVSILRGIDCNKPHRAHIDILESIGDKEYPSFEELYLHWKEVFSSELLTKKFYNELSDWYAWAVQVARFPNDLKSSEDDDKFNHESCIRLITRLIFVWFLKQKHLIPEEFFDEKYIKENFIEEFNPHDRKNLLYNAEESKYYRAILQNLFFAMLNCPIVAEGKDTPNNRRFRGDGQFGYKRDGYNINNLMRYMNVFMEGGADKFVQIANSSVPFLNGGLFDCLDNKSEGLYYDGFSERKESLEQLYLPDWLFFGEEVGAGIDLSQWYDDKKKKNVSARGIIDILKRYSFTIEENTPLDQEVSLDPELLGKVFENLLAAYNPETKSSARKQTGSFYTPREIVQYMVNESLVAHLNRICGDEMEPKYRALLDYSTNDVELTKEQKKSIMTALYNCRVLDPACGSGAFPMGILQQMVHVLKRIDPSNEMWESMMVDIAIAEAKKELEKVTAGNDAEKAKIEENRKARLDDIENAFNQSINDPDYARKLYLIEHCIYGVDIQPIATQISKLRFFISLVVDQKPTKDAKNNFGIRPLPNLEAKFVTANTLIPLDRTKDLFTNTDEIRYYEEQLQDINHRIFLAKKNTVKKELKQLMYSTRAAMAQTMEKLGAIGSKGYDQLMSWDMFNQNSSASFFDPEWMFGVKGGFDVVIGNPPYVKERDSKETFSIVMNTDWGRKYHSGKMDFWYYFLHKAIDCICDEGSICFVTSRYWINSKGAKKLIERIKGSLEISKILDIGNLKLFENVVGHHMVTSYRKTHNRRDCMYLKLIDDVSNIVKNEFSEKRTIRQIDLIINDEIIVEENAGVSSNQTLANYCLISQGVVEASDKISNRMYKRNPNPLFHIGQGIFVLSKTELEELNLNDTEKTIIKKYAGDSAISRYSIDYSKSRYLIYSDETSKKQIETNNDFINIRRHLDFVQEYITSSFAPYGIHRARKQYFFEKNKIIGPSMFKFPSFAYDTDQLYVGMSYNVIINNSKIDLKYFLGLLNSKFANNWFYNNAKHRGVGVDVGVDKLRSFPIVVGNNSFYSTIVSLVDAIICKRSQSFDNSTKELENSLDHIIYHLYGISYNELLAIDPETSITREEYDNFKLD